MANFLPNFAILAFTLISPNLAVPIGEICHPLIPQYWCDSGLNLKCTEEFNGVHTCQCLEGHILNADGKGCGGTLEYSCDPGLAINCNADRGLWCMTHIGYYGKCTCNHGRFFDRDLQTCVTMLGFPCDPNASPDDPFGLICLPGGKCNPDSRTCECDEGYESPEGYLAHCYKINGSLGSACERNEDCDYTNYRLECSEEGKCDCAKSQGYHLSVKGECLKNYGESCSIIDICDYYRFQACSSSTAWPGTCNCHRSWEMEYNPETEECGALVGRPCAPNGGIEGIGCVMNAACVQHNSTTATCECNPGYLPAIDNRSCVQGPKGIKLL